MQQDCGCYRSDAPRRADFCDAGNLFCGIQTGLLDFGANAAAPHSLWAFCPARLLPLACILTGRLADILACIHWLTVSCDSFGNHHLLCDTPIGESGSNTSKSRVADPPKPFANQSAPTKVLRVEGIYAFITPISCRFFRFSRQRGVSPLG